MELFIAPTKVLILIVFAFAIILVLSGFAIVLMHIKEKAEDKKDRPEIEF